MSFGGELTKKKSAFDIHCYIIHLVNYGVGFASILQNDLLTVNMRTPDGGKIALLPANYLQVSKDAPHFFFHYFSASFFAYMLLKFKGSAHINKRSSK